jgi:hypothetical protein
VRPLVAWAASARQTCSTQDRLATLHRPSANASTSGAQDCGATPRCERTHAFGAHVVEGHGSAFALSDRLADGEKVFLAISRISDLLWHHIFNVASRCCAARSIVCATPPTSTSIPCRIFGTRTWAPHKRLRTDDRENLQDRRDPAIQLDKEPAVIVREPNAAGYLAPQNNQLMSERRILGFKPALRLERRGQDGHYETQQRDHSALTSGDSFG